MLLGDWLPCFRTPGIDGGAICMSFAGLLVEFWAFWSPGLYVPEEPGEGTFAGARNSKLSGLEAACVKTGLCGCKFRCTTSSETILKSAERSACGLSMGIFRCLSASRSGGTRILPASYVTELRFPGGSICV